MVRARASGGWPRRAANRYRKLVTSRGAASTSLPHVTPARPGSDCDGRAGDLDAAKPGEVDDDAAVVRGAAADAVAAGADGQWHLLRPGVGERLGDLRRGTWAQHQAGRPGADVGRAHLGVGLVAWF